MCSGFRDTNETFDSTNRRQRAPPPPPLAEHGLEAHALSGGDGGGGGGGATCGELFKNRERARASQLKMDELC